MCFVSAPAPLAGSECKDPSLGPSAAHLNKGQSLLVNGTAGAD